MKPIEDLGVPVRAARGATSFAGRDAAGTPCVFVCLDCDSGLQFLQIDPATGNCRSHRWPVEYGGGGPTIWSDRWRRFFCYSGQSMTEPGQLIEFDPASGALVNHGRIHPDKVYLPVSMDEAPDGTIYLGSYHCGCALTAFRPDTGRFRQFGTMAENEFYFYVRCGADGTVAGLVKMARPHVVAIDPGTGTHQAIGPVADTNTQTGHVELIEGHDGLLYIDSHDGMFRVNGFALTRVDVIPHRTDAPTLADGTIFRLIDNRVVNRTLEIISPRGERRIVRFDYDAPGAGIYLVRPGPDGKVYGSSALPLRFFSHDPASGINTDHGQCSTSSGEIYSMDSMNGKLYFCAYTHAILGEYDPARPYSFGGEIPGQPGKFNHGKYFGSYGYRFGPDDNPRQLGRIDPVAYRPRDMVAGPAGKVWIVSIPDYGMLGGTLTWYDPRTERFGGAHRNIIPDCSPTAITYIADRDMLALGFTIYGGSGTIPRASSGGFALWDPTTDREIWCGTLGMQIVGIMDMEYAGAGLVYAIVHPAPETVLDAQLMLLDLPGRRIVSCVSLSEQAGWPLEVSFQRDAQYLYGATRESIYRVVLGTTRVEVLWKRTLSDPSPTAGGALMNDRYYFAAHDHLYSLKIH